MRRTGGIIDGIKQRALFGVVVLVVTIAVVNMNFYLGGMLYQLLKGNGIAHGFDTWQMGRGAGWNHSFFVYLCELAIAIWWGWLRPKSTADSRKINASESDTYGTSRFMGEREIKEVLDLKPIDKTTGIILGKYNKKIVSLPQDTMYNKHIFILGSSGSRKSRSFVRPTVFQSVINGQSIILTDPKGEMTRELAPYCRKHGYTVRIFNLVDPKHSDSWACLKEINGDVDTAAIFADVIISNMGDNNASEFWTVAAKNLLKALVLYVDSKGAPIPNEDRTIGEVYRILVTSNDEKLEEMFGKLPKDNPAHWPYNIYKRAGENVRASIRHELGVFLEVFQNESIRNITSFPEIDLTAPGKTKCAYFIIMSDQHRTLEFMSSMFFSFLFIKLVDYADNATEDGRLPVPVNMIMEEFCNIGRVSDFLRKLAVVRGRNIHISIIVQNLGQIMDMYPGKLYESILSNCDTHMYLGTNDPSTAKFISERAGVMGVTQKSTRQQRKTYSPVQLVTEYALNEGEGKRNLLNIDEVYTMDTDKAIVAIRGRHVMLVDKFDFTEHPHARLIEPQKVKDYIPAWQLSQKRISEAESIEVDRKTGELISPVQSEPDKKPATPKRRAPAEAKPKKTSHKLSKEENQNYISQVINATTHEVEPLQSEAADKLQSESHEYVQQEITWETTKETPNF